MNQVFSKSVNKENVKVLLVQTANPDLTDIVLDSLIGQYGVKNVTFLRQKGMQGHLKNRQTLTILENKKKSRLKTARQLRKKKFDIVTIILSGENGFWKLKMLPIYCYPTRIMLFDRFGKSTKLSGKNIVKWVIGESEKLSDPLGPLRLLRTVCAPLIFLFLARKYFMNRPGTTNKGYLR